MTPEELQKLRREYIQKPFNEDELAESPFVQFESWFKQAQEKQLDMPNAMTLATVSESGQPQARVVLLKEFSEAGFTFFTNYQSAKGKALASNTKASLLFYWNLFDRQIRIEGDISKVSKEESENYFHSRPIESQISASVSPQSNEVPNRNFLEDAYQKASSELTLGENLELPENWGGFILKPNYFEFWQGRENRLHDRLCYRLENSGWSIFRVAP